MQYPNQGLQFLLKYTSKDSLVSDINCFEAEFNRNENSFTGGKHQSIGKTQPSTSVL